MARGADGAWLALGAAGVLALAAGLRGSAATRYPYTDSLINTWALITVSPRRIESVEVWAEEDDAREEARARHVEHRLCRPPAVAPIASGHDWLVVRIFPNGQVSGTSYPTLLEAKREASGLWQMHESERAAGRRSLYDLAIYRLGDETGTRVADPSTGFLPRITDAAQQGSRARDNLHALVVDRYHADAGRWKASVRLYASLTEALLAERTVLDADRTGSMAPGRTVVTKVVTLLGHPRYLLTTSDVSHRTTVLDLDHLQEAKQRARNALTWSKAAVIYRIDGTTLTKIADRPEQFLPRITDRGSPARLDTTEGGLAALGEPWPPGLHVVIFDDYTRIVRVEVFPSERKAHEARRAARPLRGMVTRVSPDARFLPLVLHENQDVVILGTTRDFLASGAVTNSNLQSAKRMAARADDPPYPPLDLAVYEVTPSGARRVADRTTGFLPRITDAIPPKGSPARTCSTEGGLAALGEPWPPGLHVIILYDSYRIVRAEVHPTAWKARATSRVEGGRLLRSRILAVPPDGRFLALVLHRDQPIHVLGTGQPDLGAAKHLARRADSSVFRPEDLAVYEVRPSGAIRVADRTIGLLPRITDVPR